MAAALGLAALEVADVGAVVAPDAGDVTACVAVDVDELHPLARATAAPRPISTAPAAMA